MFLLLKKGTFRSSFCYLGFTFWWIRRKIYFCQKSDHRFRRLCQSQRMACGKGIIHKWCFFIPNLFCIVFLTLEISFAGLTPSRIPTHDAWSCSGQRDCGLSGIVSWRDRTVEKFPKHCHPLRVRPTWRHVHPAPHHVSGWKDLPQGYNEFFINFDQESILPNFFLSKTKIFSVFCC